MNGQTLLIVKNQGSPSNFTHTDNLGGTFSISDFEFVIRNGEFQIQELNGAELYKYTRSDILLRDDSSGVMGSPYGATSSTDLYNKLYALNYTPFIRSITALISADAGNQIVLGSDGLLFVAAGSGGGSGGGVLDTQIFIWEDTDPQTFTLTTGYTARQVHVSGSYLRKGLWSQAGLVVTVAQELSDGDDIEILVQQN